MWMQHCCPCNHQMSPASLLQRLAGVPSIRIPLMSTYISTRTWTVGVTRTVIYKGVVSHGVTHRLTTPVVQGICRAVIGSYGKGNFFSMDLMEVGTVFPVNTKHLYNIFTMLYQHRRRWADVVQMLYKCFVFAGLN